MNFGASKTRGFCSYIAKADIRLVAIVRKMAPHGDLALLPSTFIQFCSSES